MDTGRQTRENRRGITHGEAGEKRSEAGVSCWVLGARDLTEDLGLIRVRSRGMRGAFLAGEETGLEREPWKM